MKIAPVAVFILLVSPARSEPLDCTIHPSLKVEVTSPVEGILQDVLVEQGERVVEGQILAQLQSDVERASLAIARARAESRTALQTAESRYGFYQTRLDRARQLFDRKAAPAEALERAQTEFTIAEHELENARTDLKFAALEVKRAEALLALKTVRSPFDGIVVQQFLDPGALVGDRAIILELANLDPLIVRAFVPVKDYPVVTASSRATVLPQAPFDTPISTEITHVDSVFDMASGTFGVELSFANPDYRMPSGLRCTLNFNVGD
ncbi:efflux RND transporter periplasmic adaptor subunit [Sedimentitalea sp. JM2-8]|uniref:Efflux RND transporter periplasmic adaptor subunit n=1 Tax=Sedimentitalea xiamensis TaxID=3050037 RepID=A0ABT7FKC1_9RHOB|nr:efflux RND transporter periplasmic adaptor subunit [Sedimentitalea xiamensis]MDK3075580.1 efflux RND transporter periplasmic adaptor subunit [Sedimentitalea xiamensis]